MELKSNELELESYGDSIVVRFTRPEIRNPLSVSVLEQIDDTLDDLDHDTAVSTVVFTGSGTSFASGADLREIADIRPADAAAFSQRGQRTMAGVAALPQRTIAAINGYCFGGALDLALACDFRIASPGSMFAHPGTGLGIITGWGGTQRLPRLVGQSNALEMFFTASAIDAAEAFRIGLVDLVTDAIFDNEVLSLCPSE